MADITNSSTPEGAKQESTDAQTFDELTSLQQEGASGPAAEKADVTVSSEEPTKEDDPSLLTETQVKYGGSTLPEGSVPSPIAVGPTAIVSSSAEQASELTQSVNEVTAQQELATTPMALETPPNDLEGVEGIPPRIDQTPPEVPFVPAGFVDPSEVVVTQEDQAVTGNLLAGTISPDGEVSITGFEVNGQTFTSGQTVTLDGIGQITIGATGTYTFTPEPNWNGVLPEIGYTMTDGFSTDTSTLNITVNPVNDPASVGSEAQALTETDVVLSTSGQLSVSDVDVGEAQVIAQTAVQGQYGQFSIEANGSWSYITNSAYNELPLGQQLSESFTVSSVDASSVGTVTITITGTNDLATVSSQSVELIEADNIVLSANGVLTITDVDAGEAHVVSQTSTTGIYGQFSIEESGAWTYITNSAFDELPAGTQISETFSVSSHDGTGAGSVTITITGTNDVAILSSESQTLLETDTVLNTSGQLSISDIDTGEAFVIPMDGVIGTYGTFSIDENGAWSYQTHAPYDELNQGDEVSDTFAVTSKDGTATNVVTITIIGTNDLATVSSETVTLNETDDVLTTGGALFVTDPDAGEAHVIAQTQVDGSWGTFSIDEDGVWSYVAHSDYNELNANDQIGESFTVTSQDGTAIGTVSIAIIGTNDIATLSSATVTLEETNEVLTTGGHLIVTDVDEGEAFVKPVTNLHGSYGSFSIDAQGNWSYQTDAAFDELNEGDQITDQFTVSSQDGTASNTVTVTILGTNDQASLSYAVVTLDETDSPLSVGGSLVVQDPDEGEAHVQPLTNVSGSYGFFSIDENGIWSYTANSAYNELNAGDEINDTFTVTSQDGTAINTVSVTIIGTNDLAVVSSEEKILHETNEVLSTGGDLVITDLDENEAKITPRTNIEGTYGTFNIDENGVWTYVAKSEFNELNAGDTIGDTFIVESVDHTATATVSVTIVGTNDLATVSSAVVQMNESDEILTTGGTLMIGDLDEGEAHVTPIVDQMGAFGTFSVNADGVWSYITNSPFNELNAGDQLTETFSVHSVDGTATGTVTVTIVGTNDLAFVSSETVTLDETDAALTTGGLLSISDLDEGEAHVQPRTNIPGTYGVFNVDEHGVWSYTANSAYNELNAGDQITDQFIVTSVDGTATGQVTVTIIGTNDIATVSSESITLQETNDVLSTGGDLIITDLDDREAHILPRADVVGDYGTFNIDEDGIWTYVAKSEYNELNAGDSISDTFIVESVDHTATATVSVTIIGTNDLATVSSAVVQLTETDEVLTTGGTLLVGDLDEGEAQVTAIEDQSGAYGTFSINADGVWSYVTNSPFNELNQGDQLTDTFSVHSVDGTATGTVTVTINGTNDLAYVSSETVTLDETDAALTTGGTLSIADLDEGEAHVQPRTSVPGTYGVFNIDEHGVWSYTANSAYNELNAADQISDQFIVTSMDGTATGQVTVTIIGTNDLATVSSESVTLQETNEVLSTGGDLVITDLDENEAKITPRDNVEGTYGTFSIDENGIWTYIAKSTYDELNVGQTISDSFVVQSVDGTGSGQITVTIVGTNDIATVSSATVNLLETNEPLTTGGTLLIGDLDAGQAHVTPMTHVQGLHGVFSINEDGVWTYAANSAFDELNAGDVISESFTVNSVDGTGSGAVTVSITGTNDLAQVSSQTVILEETNDVLSTGGALSVGDLDEGEAHIEPQINVSGDHGVFSIDEFGNWTYVANSAFNELAEGESISDTFEVQSHDGTGTGHVTVTILGTADNPMIGTLQVYAGEVSHDETVGIQTDAGADDSSSQIFSVFDAIAQTPMGMAELVNAAVLSGSADFTPAAGGSSEITGYELTTVDKASFNGEATNLEVTGGNAIYLFTEGDLVVGRESGTNRVAFAISIDDNGTVQLVQYLAIDHGDGAGLEDGSIGANELRELLSDGVSPIYITEYVTATNSFGESSDFEIRSANPLQIGFLDDGPSVEFSNIVLPVNAENLYTGTWTFQSGVDTTTGLQDLMENLNVQSVQVSGVPVTFSPLQAPEMVDGKLVYNGTFEFDSDPDPAVTAMKTVNYTLTLSEQSPGQYQYTLNFDKAIQNIVINDSEFSGSVHAGGPSPVYDVTYTDTTTNETLTAQITVQTGAAPTQVVIGSSTTVNPTFTGSALNASANGIGIDTPNMDSEVIKGSKGQPTTYTVEGMNFNPEGEASQITIGFKGSGSPSWGSTDVLHLVVHGVAMDTLEPIDLALTLTGMGSPSSPIPGTVHVPAGSASYTINLPEGMAYMQSVDVSTGFSMDARGNVIPTVANITFGFATITSIEISDLPIHFEFEGAVTDADGDLVYDNFAIETMTDGILAGTNGTDTLIGTAEADNISGGDGIDTISGDVGNDFLIGGAEGDAITGGEGADTIYGDADITSAAAYTGDDIIHGDAGDDVIHGDAGTDTLYGDAGQDLIHGDSGADVISGGDDSDVMFGDADNDVITGDSGNDQLLGGAGDDQLIGGAGDDILVGGLGADTLTGGEGNDQFILNEDGEVDTITDFSPGDQLDLSEVLPSSPEIDPNQFQDYVQLIDDGDSGAASLWVDADGSGSAQSWEHIADLENVDPDEVDLHYDPATQTIDFSHDAGDWDVTEATVSPEDPSVNLSGPK